jgi:hypothetical protein
MRIQLKNSEHKESGLLPLEKERAILQKIEDCVNWDDGTLRIFAPSRLCVKCTQPKCVPRKVAKTQRNAKN